MAYHPVCVEGLIGKQKKPILFKVTEPSSEVSQDAESGVPFGVFPDTPNGVP